MTDLLLASRRAQAHANLVSLAAILDNLGIFFWLDGGTLLGAYRDGEFPPDDEDDIDLSTWATYKHLIPELISRAQSAGFTLYHHWTGDSRALGMAPEIALMKDGLKIDVFFFEVTGEDTWHLLYKNNRGTAVVTPLAILSSFSPIVFRGTTFSRPTNIDGYLTHRYGDWRTPKHRSTFSYTDNTHLLARAPDYEYWTPPSEPDLSNLTLCISAFERPLALAAMMTSVRAHYPSLRIIVGDNSERPSIVPNHSYAEIPLPFDCGVAFARNALLDVVATEYVMFCDDDFIFIDETRIETLVGHLESNLTLDLVAGMVLSGNGREGHYEGLLEIDNGVLRYIKGDRGKIGGLPIYDLVFNFFVARTDKVRQVRWDPRLKLAEHTPFFYRAKGVMTCAYDSTVRVRNTTATNSTYRAYRNRGYDFVRIWFKEMGIRESVNFKGERYVLDDH